MLAVTPLRGSNGEERDMGDAGDFSMLEDFSDRALLEDINFDDIFVGFDVDGDILPDLEVDPTEILAEFSVGGEEESGTTATMEAGDGMSSGVGVDVTGGAQGAMVMEGGGTNEEDNRDLSHSEEALSSTAAEDAVAAPSSEVRSASPEAERGRKTSTAAGKNAQGKRKVKVDWTPELHRRFVQAVEQLGVDKAVPSRILELMGIDCLTRHNIASHLQKYRSHRKHLLAREAEAASWSQRRQMYATGGGGAKRDINPWLAPTIGFPPPPPPPPPAAAAPAVQAYRPLHVWGHPTMEQPLVPMWPRHLAPRTPTPAWAPQLPLPPPPPSDPSYWHHHYQRGAREGWIPHAMTQGTPCFPHQPLPAAKFPAPAVPGIVPHPMYRPVPPPMASSKQPAAQLQLEAHPSKESIDAAIGDVLRKPLSPLPLGLKPPSLDSVLLELQKQGVSKVPPPTCTT